MLVAIREEEVAGRRRQVCKRAVGGELCPGRLEVDPVAGALEGVEQWGGDVVDEPGRDVANLGVPLCGDSHEALVAQRQLARTGFIEQRRADQLEPGQVRAGLALARA